MRLCMVHTSMKMIEDTKKMFMGGFPKPPMPPMPNLPAPMK